MVRGKTFKFSLGYLELVTVEGLAWGETPCHRHYERLIESFVPQLDQEEIDKGLKHRGCSIAKLNRNNNSDELERKVF